MMSILQMSDIMHEREMDKKKMTTLTQHVRALEVSLLLLMSL